MERMLQTARDHLVWEETTRGNPMDPSFVREKIDGRALYWAYCPVCGWADLFPCVGILRGEACFWCAKGEINFNHTRCNSLMKPMTCQQEACAAFLVGGIEAVAAMTPPEVQRAGAHLQAAVPEEP